MILGHSPQFMYNKCINSSLIDYGVLIMVLQELLVRLMMQAVQISKKTIMSFHMEKNDWCNVISSFIITIVDIISELIFI